MASPMQRMTAFRTFLRSMVQTPSFLPLLTRISKMPLTFFMFSFFSFSLIYTQDGREAGQRGGGGMGVNAGRQLAALSDTARRQEMQLRSSTHVVQTILDEVEELQRGGNVAITDERTTRRRSVRERERVRTLEEGTSLSAIDMLGLQDGAKVQRKKSEVGSPVPGDLGRR